MINSKIHEPIEGFFYLNSILSIPNFCTSLTQMYVEIKKNIYIYTNIDIAKKIYLFSCYVDRHSILLKLGFSTSCVE